MTETKVKIKPFDIQKLKQAKAIEGKNKRKLLQLFPTLNDKSGIYIMVRQECGFKFCYVGQAQHILTRCSQHLTGYQWIDNSIRTHGLYSKDNPTGWFITCKNFPVEQLNDKEREYIQYYANEGFQMRNITSGGQDEGKVNLNTNKDARGYREGVAYGYLKARRDVAKWFGKNLIYLINGKETVNKLKSLRKFEQFIDLYDAENSEEESE